MATKPTSNQKTSTMNETKARKQRPALSATLRTVPALEGIERLRDLHTRYGLIPATAVDNIEGHLGRLEAVLSDNEISTFQLAKDADLILATLAGVERTHITREKPTEVAEQLHTYRNLSLAVAALAASTINAASVATQPETVYAHATKLAQRSIQMRRPFADDEIVLCRVAGHLRAFTDPCDHAATIYTLVDSGLAPGETTHVTIEDFDEPEMPQLLLAAGNRNLEARYIDLDQFATHLVGRHLERALRAGHSPKVPLTYNPRSPKNGAQHEPGSSSAIASAQGILDRFLQQLQLPTGDITASSITQWRVATVLATRGADAALAISGRVNHDAMYRALGTTTGAKAERPDDHDITFEI